MKDIVRKSAYSFAVWLAEFIECVDGYNLSDYAFALDFLPIIGTDDNHSSGGGGGSSGGEDKNDATTLASLLSIDMSIIRMEDDIMISTSDGYHDPWNNYHIGGAGIGGNIPKMEDVVLHNLCSYLKVRATKSTYAILSLTILETYHLAKCHILINIDQLIVSFTEEVINGINKGSKLFSATTGSNNHKNQWERIDLDGSISNQSDLVSSSIITLYASIYRNNTPVKV